MKININRNQILRDLFLAHYTGNFKEVAQAIIDEERKKNNPALADELQKIIDEPEYARETLRASKVIKWA